MDKEFNMLYQKYSDYSEEELLDIVNSGTDYREVAKKAAQAVLDSDRSIYYYKINEQANREKNYNGLIN